MDVRLNDNRLVLVGENGAGKSTFVNLIYYFLTKQWNRLHDYRFSRLQAHLGDQELVLTPEHLEQDLATRQHLHAFMRFPGKVTRRGSRATLDQLMHFFYETAVEGEKDLIEQMSSEFEMPPRIARDFVDALRKETKGKPTHIQTLERLIDTLVQGQFLYLPTYRRIEQDLRSIFRAVEIESELRKFRERLGRRS
jgi:energy-coupling factor transporter ATP-binding protein EcfA2